MGNKNKYIVVSFSGGRTSAFMSQYIINSDTYKDFEKVFVFANTGKEHEKTLDFVERCDKEFGMNLVWVENDEDIKGNLSFKIVNYKTASRNGEPFEKVIKRKNAIPSTTAPYCSEYLKQYPINKYLKSIGITKHNSKTAIGIRYDERNRVNWETAKKRNLFYPLVTDFPIDSTFIRKYWDAQCFDLGLSDYEGNCDLCYKKSNRKLMTLILENEGIEDWWRQMEDKYSNNGELQMFRGNMTTQDLVEMSKQPFAKSIDKHQLNEKQIKMFGDDLDIGGNCFCR
tara:strand:+ start:48 stop:899 length:852 start_codon:yes stop_codon:yes gene_type:complete